VEVIMRARPFTVRVPVPVPVPALALAVFLAAPLAAQEHQHTAGVGSVAFPTSCAPAVQPVFERAVASLHSFWFPEAEQAFRDVAAADPSCAMAWWGVAMTRLGNPLAGRPSAENERVGAEAAARAVALGGGDARERAFIAAVEALYRDIANADYRARMRAYETAMAHVVRDNHDDVEAAIFHALAMIANAPPTDLTFERQKRAAEVLNPLFARHPQHPGLAHYIIHAYDSPPLAQLALDAARRYAAIAPAAPHALHMPSHIFTRLGYWDESIATNARSAETEPNPSGRFHPYDYMVYAFLQQGRDREARAVIEGSGTEITERPGYTLTIVGYNHGAMPARYALERGAWAEAAALPEPAAEPAARSYPHAVTYFARAIGAARSGDAAGARTAIDALEGIEQNLARANDAYWAGVVKAQRLAASAWAAHASGDDAAAVRLAREAAALEDTFEKHPVTPGPILPARELEADLLLELGRPADALRAYEATLAKEPNRARSLFGVARAAEQAGDAATAAAHYRRYLAVQEKGDGTRDEVRHARRVIGG
jgi:tetratricopeptide (TPR) repeat protein